MAISAKTFYLIISFIIILLIMAFFLFLADPLFKAENTSPAKLEPAELELEGLEPTNLQDDTSSPVQIKPVTEIPAPTKQELISQPNESPISWSMKLVNEDVTDEDLDQISSMGFTIISGEWGLDEISSAEMIALLDRLKTRGLKLVVNFSEGAAWGYKEDGTDAVDQKPVWQSQPIQNYIKSIKDHPAIFGYDISNEAGENLPNGDKYRITLLQMQIAALFIRTFDPKRPIIIRMHYWDEEDGDFNKQNPFADNIADIVMLNLYSNYSLDQKTPLLPNMISDNAQILIDKIHKIDDDVEVWLALSAFTELPNFIQPSADDLLRDIQVALELKGISNIGFFGWGPERYPDTPPGWYLPRDGQELIEVIKKLK